MVDFALWRRSDRDRYKRLVEDVGGTWTLIYLKAEPGELRRRLDLRSRRFDANAAFPITPELLDAYLTALALFSLPSPDFIEANRIRDESGCVLRYDRTFMRPLFPS